MSRATSQQSDDTSGHNFSFDPQSRPADLTPYISKADEQYVAGGAFGDVYRCVYAQGSASKEVAVKAFRFKVTMEGDTAGDKHAKMRRRELGIWKGLDHPNVVPFLGIAYGFGMKDTTSLVSLWMSNGSLHNFLAKHDDSLDMAHRLQLLLDIANGLHYLHSSLIVHGDLNSNNVLLDADYNARLVDFGYASFMGDTPEGMSYLQRSTAHPGALRWCAPEQIESEDTLQRTHKSDIYSFGCIALQVLSGKQPWSEVRGDVAITLRLAKGQKPCRPESRAIDDSHWDFIQHCWSPKAGRPTAEVIISTTRQFLDNCSSSRPLRDFLIPQSDNTASLRDSMSLFGRGYLDTGFTKPRIAALEMMGDDASHARKHEDAVKAYSDASSLSLSVPYTLMSKWARTLSICLPVIEALTTATKPSRFDIYRAICDVLEVQGSTEEAIKCFRCMHEELKNTVTHDEQAKWEHGFQCRCVAGVREKLSMASVCQTTCVEDIAYALIGIFNISMPIIYGEGYHAIGRLLEHVLTGSGDVTILAWTGTAGKYNSCLPVDLAVYSNPVPPHVPQPIKKTEMDNLIVTLRSSLDGSVAKMLYKQLKHLALPSLTTNRLRLPGIIFPLTTITPASGPDSFSAPRVYEVTTSALGSVEIKTTDYLIGLKDLYLIHPWIHPLLNQEHEDGANQMDKFTRALRFIARLRQPFGALLFQRLSHGIYKRVAADCLIIVRIHEDVSLADLIDSIDMINAH